MTTKISEKISRPGSGVLIIFLFSFVRHGLRILPNRYANGWDSYFYLVQLQALDQTGQMHSADLSLVYPLLRLVHFFAPDYELAFKITTVVLAACFSALIFVVVFRLTQKSAVAFLAASISVFSPTLSYLAAQFPKNMLGLIFFIFTLIALFSEQKNKPRFFATLFLVLVLNFFGHRSTAVLSLVFAGVYFFTNQYTKLVIWGLVGIIPVFVLVHFLPGLFSFFDLERFSNQFSLQLFFSITEFIQLFGPQKLNLFWYADLGVALVLFVLLLLDFQHNKPIVTAFLLLILLLNIPFFKWSMEGIALRLFLIFMAIAPVFAFALSRYSSKLTGWAAIFFLVFSFFPQNGYRAQQHDPPYWHYQLISNQIQLVAPKNTELIIAHKGLAEFITFKNQTDAMPWLPEYEINPQKLYRIAYLPLKQNLKFYANNQWPQITPLGLNYYWLSEHLWQEIIRKVKAENDETLLLDYQGFMNPWKIRPNYLLKNKQE